jgi:hypothetical protein
MAELGETRRKRRAGVNESKGRFSLGRQRFAFPCGVLAKSSRPRRESYLNLGLDFEPVFACYSSYRICIGSCEQRQLHITAIPVSGTATSVGMARNICPV